MEDDEAEMARLRKSKRHQAFEQKFDRPGARIVKQMRSEQMNASSPHPPSPSPPPKSNANPFNTNSASNPTLSINDTAEEDAPSIVITEEDIQSLPTAFGKQKTSKPAHDAEKNKRKVNFSDVMDDDNDSNIKSEVDTDNKLEKSATKYVQHIISQYAMPMKYVAKLKGHSKLISTMSLDRSGTRLLTGSYDNTVKFWDFGGMNENLESFRSITPYEGYPVKTVQYNATGSTFLCCTTSHKAKIYNRDARQLVEFAAGDMYIRDMNHTFGHTMPLMGGKWFGPNASNQNVNEISTWSQDSTFRIWDVEDNTSGHCKQIIKARNKTGKRISICSADFNDNNGFNSFLIVIGCNDGSIQLFDHKSHCKRPKKIVANAHIAGTDISEIMFDKFDGNYFLSRGGMNDNTLKVWDIRNISKSQPIKVFEDMWNITSLSNVTQCPNDRLYVTTCSSHKDEKNGKSVLCLIDKHKLTEMIRIPISNKPINSVLWHKKINQVFVGGNDNSVRVYYDDAPKSKNGVLLCAKRKYKKKHIDEQVNYFKIVNPNALRVYKRQSRIMAEKRKKDLLLHKPTEPHYGLGQNGRINTESFTHHVYKSQEKNVMSQVDPRDRLLMFNEKAVQNQEFTAIYNINQPKAVFQEKDEQELEANNIVSKLYSDMPGARQYNPINAEQDVKEPPKKKQKI